MHIRITGRSFRVRCCAASVMLCLALAWVGAAIDDDPPAIRPMFGAPKLGPIAETKLTQPVFSDPIPVVEPMETIVPPLDEGPRAFVGEPRPRKAEPERAEPEAPALGLQLNPPNPDLLFRLESERALRDRMRREAQSNPKLPKPEFPEDRPQTAGTVAPRQWPWHTTEVEPTYLCHGRLFFEQTQAERYGRDFGPLHPLLSTGIFAFDVAALPVRAVFWPWHPYECHVDCFSAFFGGWTTKN
jgi:hypothetical protein